jgi:hypothetical protein
MADKIQVQSGSVGTGAVIAERHRNPAVMMPAKSNASYTFAGICAILATLVFAAMVVILWLDWSALKMA